MNTILTDDERPKLPFSPYLLTEWKSPEDRVSNTMYTADHLQAYADAREAAVLAKLAAQAEVWFEDNNGAMRKRPENCQRFGANGVPAAVWVKGKRYAPEVPAHPIPHQWREAMKVAREALGEMERAVDLHLGRSSWTQTTGLKGMAYSEYVRKGLYTAHDQARAALAQLDALGGVE